MIPNETIQEMESLVEDFENYINNQGMNETEILAMLKSSSNIPDTKEAACGILMKMGFSAYEALEKMQKIQENDPSDTRVGVLIKRVAAAGLKFKELFDLVDNYQA